MQFFTSNLGLIASANVPAERDSCCAVRVYESRSRRHRSRSCSRVARSLRAS